MRLVLVNPNANPATTEAMVAIAQAAAEGRAAVEGLAAPFGAPLIVEPEAHAVAAAARRSPSSTASGSSDSGSPSATASG